VATTPAFTATPRVGMASISTANTNRDGTGTVGSVITGATNGTRIDRITISATGTIAAGAVTLFIFDGSSTTEFWAEVLTPATTPSTTVAAFHATITSPDAQNPLLVLPNNYVLRAGTTIAQTFHVIAQGGDF
jgi:hypothetical protein